MFKALHFLFVVLLACLTLIVSTRSSKPDDSDNQLTVRICHTQTAQYSADSPACAKLCSDKLPVANVSTPAFS